MAFEWNSLIVQVDELIRGGQINEARRVLMAIVPKEVPRPHVAPLARLARRTRLNYLTLRILKPVVQREGLLELSSSEEELALFAGALIRVGGRKQGVEVLSKLDSEKNPEILMFQVDAYFSEWNYLVANPLLRRYIQSDGISDYQRLVGNLNLAASFVFENRIDQAQDLLSQLRAECRLKGHKLLYANSLELSAQVSLSRGKFSEANSRLELAAEISQKGAGSYSFFLAKWRAISDLMQNPTDRGRTFQVEQLKIEATNLNDWESLRQLDFFRAIATRDEQLYLHLMAGTPYRNYRDVLTRRFIEPPKLPSNYTVKLEGPSRGAPQSINKLKVYEGKFQNHNLPKGGLPHRLLVLLSQDFYRPLPVGEAFSSLYEEEYFDPESSPNRVQNAANRLSGWFKEHNVPIVIKSDHRMFKIVPLADILLEVGLHRSDLNRTNHRIEKLEKEVNREWFTVSQAMELLGTGQRTTQRLLREISNRLRAAGKGRNRRYQFIGPQQLQYRK